MRSRGAPAARTPDELAAMRRAGAVVAEMHERIHAAIAPGVSTAQLDQIAAEVVEHRGARSNFLGYHGYPAVICASVNDVIVHGIPSELTVLDDGDLISIDCGAVVDGWHGDAAWTHPVGEVDDTSRRLVEASVASLRAAVAEMRAGHTIGDIGAVTEETARSHGFEVIRDYTGHGIGQAMHEEPSVPNHGRRGGGATLRPGNTLALEPMLVAGRRPTVLDDDGWTVRTRDGARAAHVEVTVAVTDGAPDVLTHLPFWD